MSRNLGITPVTEKPYYFISYNSEDEARVAEFTVALSKHGFPMWYDYGIKVGKEWETEIADKMEGCEAVIMFLSASIFDKENSYVHKEFELATEYFDKNIYVVILDEIKKTDVPNRFKLWWINVTKLQCINAFEFIYPEACVEKLLDGIGFVSSVESIPKSQQSSFQKITIGDGIVYEGELVDGKPHGIGKMTFPVGDVYEGEFVNGSYHGRGKLTFADGMVYEGEFEDDSYHGKGKLSFANGTVYEGDFQDDDYHGKGKLITADGEIYEGDFANGKYHGKGKLTYSDGGVYEGDFVNGKRHGKGKYIYANGAIYEGDFSNDALTGKGKYTGTNGGIHEGDFVNGRFHGIIKSTHPNGTVTTDVWDNDKFITRLNN